MSTPAAEAQPNEFVRDAAADERRRHGLAVAVYVFECVCGATFDGYTREAAFADFSAHCDAHGLAPLLGPADL